MFEKCFSRFLKSALSENVRLDLFSGGDGSSIENAVKIKAANSMEGISGEYIYISIFCGILNSDWTIELQSLLSHDDKMYDMIRIKLKNGDVKEFYFNITDFFGKF